MVEIPWWVLLTLALGLIVLFVFELYVLYCKPPESRRDLCRSLVLDGILLAIIVPLTVYDIIRGAHSADITLGVILSVLIAVVAVRRFQLFRRARPQRAPLPEADAWRL